MFVNLLGFRKLSPPKELSENPVSDPDCLIDALFYNFELEDPVLAAKSIALAKQAIVLTDTKYSLLMAAKKCQYIGEDIALDYIEFRVCSDFDRVLSLQPRFP